MVSVMEPWPESITESIVDGDGVRLVVFFAGCPHHCDGCQNPSTWNINNGIYVNEENVVKEIEKRYDSECYSGITFSGGDPLFQAESIYKISKLLKLHMTGVNIWCYTGFNIEGIDSKKLKYIDVLVDGKFIKALKDKSLKFRGSSNQRIIYLKTRKFKYNC